MGSRSRVIHYHGTPISPRPKLHELAGRCFCVPFSDPRDVAICHQLGQSVMLDNGAFSFWRSGRKTDWLAFYDWADPWLDYWTTWAVIPDVIDGDEDANDALIAEWPFGTRGAPVWHLHESLWRGGRWCASAPQGRTERSGTGCGPAGWRRRWRPSATWRGCL